MPYDRKMSKVSLDMEADQQNILHAMSRTRTLSVVNIPELTAENHEQQQQSPKGLALWLIILSLCLAQFLSALDVTIVATALPTIANELNIGSGSYTWVGSAYNLANTASTPLWAKTSDIWGRKPLLIIANFTFMIGSLLAGLATDDVLLIVGRAIQGAGGGGISIMISIIIADLFPLEERATYYGLSSLVWAVASALGPVLGGVFTETLGWQWCFFINLPLDFISLLVLWLILKIESQTSDVRLGLKTFDWLGSLAVVGGTVLFLCGLEAGADVTKGWSSAYTLCLLIFGTLLLVAFVLFELYATKNPIMPMRIFHGRISIAALFAATLHSFVFISFDYYLPLYFQSVLGVAPIVSGTLLFALVIPLSTTSAATGIFIKATGLYDVAQWVGSIIMTVGTGLFITFTAEYIPWKIVVFLLITGFGSGPLFLSPMIALQNHLKQKDIAAGMSAYTFLRSISSSMSNVIGGVIVQNGLGGKSFTSSEPLTPEDKVEYAKALSNMWIFYTVVCGLMILSSFFISRGKSDAEKANASVGPEEDENIAHEETRLL